MSSLFLVQVSRIGAGKAAADIWPHFFILEKEETQGSLVICPRSHQLMCTFEQNSKPPNCYSCVLTAYRAVCCYSSGRDTVLTLQTEKRVCKHSKNQCRARFRSLTLPVAPK